MLMWVYHDVDPAQSRLCPVIALADASASVAWKMWPQNDRKLPHIPTLSIQYIQISLTYSSEVLALYLFFFRWSQGGKSACIIKLHRVSGSDSTWIIQFYVNCLPPLLNGSALKLNMQLSSADVTLVWHEAQNNGVYWKHTSFCQSRLSENTIWQIICHRYDYDTHVTFCLFTSVIFFVIISDAFFSHLIKMK